MKIEKDKYVHGVVCMACAIGVGLIFAWYSVMVAMAAGFIASMCLGLGKEYGDMHSTGNHWCWGDILADAIGAIVGCLVVFIMDLMI
ncbi:MAG: hypothetical protein RRY02_09890 [Muribaculaceae bacterium]